MDVGNAIVMPGALLALWVRWITVLLGSNPRVLIPAVDTKIPTQGGYLLYGGEGGIRTLDTLLTYTHFPGVRLQPLGHFTVNH